MIKVWSCSYLTTFICLFLNLSLLFLLLYCVSKTICLRRLGIHDITLSRQTPSGHNPLGQTPFPDISPPDKQAPSHFNVNADKTPPIVVKLNCCVNPSFFDWHISRQRTGFPTVCCCIYAKCRFLSRGVFVHIYATVRGLCPEGVLSGD